MHKKILSLACAGFMLSILSMTGGKADTLPDTQHGLSLLGTLKYPSDFKKFDYVNPNAPKKGSLVLSHIGGFDTLNGLNGKGESAPDLEDLLYETLLKPSLDEPNSAYGLLASGVRISSDYTTVEFDVRPEARWSDGQSLTPDDVIFSFNLLREKGAPYYRAYYAPVKSVERIGNNTLRFTIDKAGNREIGSILGQLPILPKHFWNGKDFTGSLTESPVGSGPYKVASFQINRRITYQRDPNYWGKELAVNKGYSNFDTLIYDAYRDGQVAFEAFKSGAVDFWFEGSAKNWIQNYDFDALKQGKVKKEVLPNKNPVGFQGFLLNLRRPLFQDRNVRQALAQTLDFEWMNQNLFFGQYKRTRSYFQGSDMEATGLPSLSERAILEPFQDKLPPEVFSKAYDPPSVTQGDIRSRLKKAQTLLKEAGWNPENGILKKNGQPFTFEFLLDDPRFERITLPLVDQLKRLGIQASVRIIDTAQYMRRTQTFDYDIIVGGFPASSSPGNEQREFWSSASADRPSSKNYIGVKDPIVDALIDKLVHAKNREELVTVTKSLDRVLQWNYYAIPHWNFQGYRVAYWDKFDKVDPALSAYGLPFRSTWWMK